LNKYRANLKGEVVMRNFMVFDIGGTTVKYAVINENREFMEKGNYPSSQHTLINFKMI
jgi:predicted NBD/HSP70 family sugar kinase